MSFRCLLILMALMCSALAFAQDEPVEDGEVTAEEGADGEGAEEGEDDEMAVTVNAGNIYIPLKPEFVVNYGGAGRLRYLKADISVRLADSKVANSVRHHMPYIRNNLVMLFSAQTDETLGSQDGKEALRQEALREVREVVMQEDRVEGVVDLFFNSIVLQN